MRKILIVALFVFVPSLSFGQWGEIFIELSRVFFEHPHIEPIPIHIPPAEFKPSIHFSENPYGEIPHSSHEYKNNYIHENSSNGYINNLGENSDLHKGINNSNNKLFSDNFNTVPLPYDDLDPQTKMKITPMEYENLTEKQKLHYDNANRYIRNGKFPEIIKNDHVPHEAPIAPGTSNNHIKQSSIKEIDEINKVVITKYQSSHNQSEIIDPSLFYDDRSNVKNFVKHGDFCYFEIYNYTPSGTLFFYKYSLSSKIISRINGQEFYSVYEKTVSQEVKKISTEATYLYIGFQNNGSQKIYIGDKIINASSAEINNFIINKKTIPGLDKELSVSITPVIILRSKIPANFDYLGLVNSLNEKYGDNKQFFLATDFNKSLINFKHLQSNKRSNYKVCIPDKNQKVDDFDVPKNLFSQGLGKEYFEHIQSNIKPSKDNGEILIGHKNDQYKKYIDFAITKENNNPVFDLSCYNADYENYISWLLATRSCPAIMYFSSKIDANAVSYVVKEFMILINTAPSDIEDFKLWQMAVDNALEKNSTIINSRMKSEIMKLKYAAISISLHYKLGANYYI